MAAAGNGWRTQSSCRRTHSYSGTKLRLISSKTPAYSAAATCPSGPVSLRYSARVEVANGMAPVTASRITLMNSSDLVATCTSFRIRWWLTQMIPMVKKLIR